MARDRERDKEAATLRYLEFVRDGIDVTID